MCSLVHKNRQCLGPTTNRRYSIHPCRLSSHPSWPSGVCGNLMSASKSTSAWNRQNSALNSLNQFAQECNQHLTWPLTPTCLRSYVAWALNVKKLAVATTRLYLSDLKNIHKQKNLCTTNFSDFFCMSMLQGAQNLSLYNGIVNRSRLAMTLVGF